MPEISEGPGWKIVWRGENVKKKVWKAYKERLYVAGEIIKKEAQRLLSMTGVASSPGQPPYIVSGDLKSSVTFEVDGRLVLNVGTPLVYGAVHEFGTRSERKITPKSAKVLSWFDKRVGKRFYSMSVTIPPQPPRPWLKPAIENSEPEWKKVMLEKIDVA